MNKLEEIEEVINLSKSFAWDTHKDSCYWLYPPYLGTFFISQYYLVLRYLGCVQQSKIDVARLKQLLLSTQREDGGWEQVPEPNRAESHLDATVFNYWFLKASESLNVDDQVMKRARKFILDQGGVASCSHMTKIWMCLFGQHDWNVIPPIPLMAFRDDYIFGYTNVRNWVAQWVYPHILPIAYLRYWKKQKSLGELFNLKELYVDEDDWKNIRIKSKPRPEAPPKNVEILMDKLKDIRRPLGTYGAYSVSTLFTLIALQDWHSSYKSTMQSTEKFEKEFKQSLDFVEDLYFNSDESSYLGVLDDGRWWDTLLVTCGLLEAGEDKNKLIQTIDHFLSKGVQKNGGIAYGLEFEYAPDTDDTGMMVLLLAKFYGKTYSKEVNRANEWLISMQNSDGGFGAFAKGNNDNFVLRLFAGDFQNSAEIVDASSVDVTAHILEGWFESGYSLSDTHIQKAIAYIKNAQTSFGAWEGRWGCNFIYAVGAVISAMGSCKEINIKNEKWLVKSIEWLVGCQNEDGGFGESTQSYTNQAWIGRGKSTASQTAWAVLALIEAEKAKLDVKGNSQFYTSASMFLLSNQSCFIF